MKKSVRLSLIVVSAIAAVSTTMAASTFIQSKEKLYELEKAARLQNLSVIALENNNYALACKAQTEAENAIKKSNTKARDVVGMLYQSSNDLCNKANKAIAQN